MSVTTPEQRRTGTPHSRPVASLATPGRRTGRVAMAVSTSALLAGSAAAAVLLDSPEPASPATVPASAGLAMVPDLPPAPQPAPPAPVPAVAAPITDLGPPATADRDDSRAEREASTSRATDTSGEDEDDTASPSRAGSAREVSVPSASEVDTDDETAEDAARDRMRDQVRDRMKAKMRSEVREWMQSHGYGSASAGHSSGQGSSSR